MYREWKTGMLALDYLPHKNAFGYNLTLDFLGSYTAYTVAELGEMLPHEVRIDDDSYWHSIRIEKWSVGDGFVWKVIYENHEKKSFEQKADTEADARAKMLIYLKENNLL